MNEGALLKLPEGWVWAIAREVCSSVRDGTHDTPLYVEKGVPLITSKNLKEKGIDFSTAKNISVMDYEKIRIRSGVENGDILFAMIGTIGNPVVVQTERTFSIKNVALFKKNESNIKSRYLKLWLSSLLLHKIIVKENFLKGTTQKFIPLGYLRILPVPLPSLPEQRAIVSKIELLFSDLDNGIANLKKAQKQLKIYRQAVLKKAFEGELTRKWRAEQTDLPSAEELLLQIKEEREKQYQKQLDEWEKAVKEWEDNGKDGKKPSRPKKLKELPPLSEEALNELQELPVGWVWDILGNITINITDGDHQPPPKSKSGIPFITISNIKSNKIDFSNTFFVNQEYYDSLIEYRKPRREDILYTVTGSFGIPVLIDFNKTFCFQRHIGLVRSYSQINKKWLFLLLQVNFIYKQAQKTATGTAQKTVALSSLRKFMIPFCSFQEQHQIVKEIETRLSVCDKLEATIAESLQKSDALRQSILKRAFEGKLLSEKELEEARNAPDWEPADKLLERINAEKEKTGNKK